MKKYIIFLITLGAFFIGQSFNVKALETSFYEGEFIKNIWINKVLSNDKNTTYFQTARYFRQVGTDKFAYCIEPTTFFVKQSTYNSINLPPNLSYEQIERIKAIAHFGYQYMDHTDEKWYAITQFMIWKEADPSGDYYFTDSLNGNRINRFVDEINEINTLINNYNNMVQPNFTNTNITIKENDRLLLTDLNNVLYNYTTSIGKIENNNLIIENLNEGTYKIELVKNDHVYNSPLIFYHSDNSQDVIIPGDYESNRLFININVVKTNLTVTKVDKETKDSIGQNNAKIEGTIYKLYDSQDNEIQDIVINSDGRAEINDISFGTYYIKEYTPGEGYKLDNNVYEFTINGNNPKVILNLEDEIISKEITLHKTYGDKEFIGEKDIVFQIYDMNNNLLNTVKTDDNGYVSLTLKYGHYKLIQLNSTDGYEKVEPITIDVDNEEKLIIELKDYKIAVPNTSINESLIEKLIKFLLLLIC